MRTILLLIILAYATPLAAQTTASQFAAQFTKKKDATKSKKGVTVHKYREIVSKPWTFDDVRKYTGHYADEWFSIDIAVDANGAARASGVDHVGAFELRNGQITDGVLTGRKQYHNGVSAPFEAVFLIRSDRDAPNDPFTVLYGIGYIVEEPTGSGIQEQRFFLTRR